MSLSRLYGIQYIRAVFKKKTSKTDTHEFFDCIKFSLNKFSVILFDRRWLHEMTYIVGFDLVQHESENQCYLII